MLVKEQPVMFTYLLVDNNYFLLMSIQALHAMP